LRESQRSTKLLDLDLNVGVQVYVEMHLPFMDGAAHFVVPVLVRGATWAILFRRPRFVCTGVVGLIIDIVDHLVDGG
jgi:hypothetical protein